MRAIEKAAVETHRRVFHGEPMVVASAPGRVNLIGEHTDYNGGLVLPFAIDRRVAIAASAGSGTVFSRNLDEERELPREPTATWADYPGGVFWSMGQVRPGLPTFDATFVGELPLGGGLSSSAAIEAATAVALCALFRLGLSRRELAAHCTRAENAFVGVQSGSMDQLASLLAEAGTALWIDCRSLDIRAIPFDPHASGLALVVCDTVVSRSLASSGYNERRAGCGEAVAHLGIDTLRDATLDDLNRLPLQLRPLARHVITENERVLASVAALERVDFKALGQLMFASHASLRDDFRVSTPELDTFVEAARSSGALGARLTGAGFGGCAITLISRGGRDTLVEASRERFRAAGFPEPAFFDVQPSAGAQVVRGGANLETAQES